MEKEQKTVTINGIKYIIRDGEAVRFTEQTLTAEQRAQARKNIGIYSGTEIPGQVGQIIQVSAVDADGKVTAVEAVDMPGGDAEANVLVVVFTTANLVTGTASHSASEILSAANSGKLIWGRISDEYINSGIPIAYLGSINGKAFFGITTTNVDCHGAASATLIYVDDTKTLTITRGAYIMAPATTTGDVGKTLVVDADCSVAWQTPSGGVNPVQKTEDMTQPVGVDEFGGLWTVPGGGNALDIDATLTESGKAADAKAVGDALAAKQPKGDYVKSVNGTAPDANGNVNFSVTAPDGSVVVDPTLTQAGVAADAAVVGQNFKGLTEELHDDVMVPYDWTQYTLRAISNYTANTVYVPNNAAVAYDGKAYKISFSGGGDSPNSTLAHGEMATLFHFRPVDGVYTEIGRYKFPSVAIAKHEYDLDFEVKAGDLFGVNSVIGTAAVNMKNKEYIVAYTDDAIAFAQAELDAGSNPYCARLFTVYISGARDTAGKEQLAAEEGSMSVLRKADVDTAPLKNMLNPDCIYSGSLSADGTIATASNAKWALIQVQPNTAYSYNRRDASKWITKTNTYSPVCFYDENMVFLGSVTEDLLPFAPEMGKTVITPDNCAYIAVTILPYGQGADYDASDIMQFERGTHNTQYEPYGKYVSAIKGVPLFRYIPMETQEYDVPVNLVVMGDSISSPGLGKWWTHILAKYSFKSARNIGIGGMCWTHTANTTEHIDFDLTNQGINGSGDNNVLTNAVNLLIDGVTNQGWTKPDVVFVYCGINDRGRSLDEDGLNYGDPEAAFEYTDDYSNLAYGDEKLQNLCGAFRFAMEKLYRAFPYVKVVVCTPMYTGNNSNKKVRALNKTIKECASWMGIPVFDLGYESYVYQKFEENGVSEKYLGDSLHPNETGGKLLADLIAHHLIARFGGKDFYDLEG